MSFQPTLTLLFVQFKANWSLWLLVSEDVLTEAGAGSGREGGKASGMSWGQLPFHLQEKNAAEHWGKRMPVSEATRHSLGAGCNLRVRVWQVQPFSW